MAGKPPHRCAVSPAGGCCVCRMMTTDSIELLRGYVRERSEAAFAALIRQHVDLVYSAALRQVNGDGQTAQDVTQAVFTDLARKAPRLTRHTSLTGWLYTSTRYLAAKTRRTEQRRRTREQEAHAMNQLLQSAAPDPAWNELRPVLDEAMHDLSAADREAVLLRFFERRPLADIGTRLGLTESAARMRVQRALDKLRAALAKRGVTSTAVALATILAERAAEAAPAGLAARASHAAFAAATVGGGLLTCLLNLFATSKVKLLSGATVAAIVAMSLLHSQRPASDAQNSPGALAATALAQATDETNPATGDTVAAPGDGIVPSSTTVASSSNRLVLKIVAADSGQPIPSVELDYWLWGSGENIQRKPLHATRFGECDVPVPRDTVTRLILVSQADGFADTLLEWRPDRGETIPQDYTLRVARSAPIGGLVVDADGWPVAGAKVGFNNRTDPASETRPQSDNFGWPFWITATTDAQGRWRIDRIAKGAIRTLDGGASHPDHVRAEAVDVNGASEAEAKLLAGTFVFKLGRAVIVRGSVVDADGRSVPGAKITVGYVGEVRSRETTSFADGSFSVGGCKPGKNLLSAEAKGFAPTTLDVELVDNSEPFTLTLQRGSLLRLRVVDQAGLPVAKASVWLNPFHHGPVDPMGEKPSPVQTEFNRDTDAEGRLEWDGAPKGEMRFDVSASGYMRVSDVQLRADGQEHTITLQPALTISGTVRDAATGQLIPRFRIITGWPNCDPVNNTTNARWSNIDRFWLSFDGGKFRHVYEEPMLGGTRDPGFMFKFEADGYAPFVTRPVQADEGEVQFDIALKAGAATSVTVFQPDGQPAANADVGLVSLGAGLRLTPGGFSRQNVQSGGSLLATDAQGRFAFPPDEAVTLIIAAHPAGYAEVPPATLTAEPVIRLQPWGRLEGKYLAGGEPASGRSLLFACQQGDRRTVSSDFTAYQVKTDDAGQFAFPQVPPGTHKLVELVPETSQPGRKAWSHVPLTDVGIRPGETTTITVGQ